MKKKNEFIAPSTLARLKNPDRLKEIQAIFRDGNSKLATEIAADKSLYDSLQRDACILGYAAPRNRDRVGDTRQALGLNAHGAGRQRAELSEEVLRCVAEFPEADVRAFYHNADPFDATHSLNKLKTDDPSKYRRLQIAAKYFDVINHDPIPAAKPEAKADPSLVAVAPRLCAFFNLPEGSRVTQEEGFRMLETYAAMVVERENAANAEKSKQAAAPAAPPVEPPAATT